MRRRRLARYLLLVLFLALIAAAFYVIWQPAFRIRSVVATGPGADAAKQIVRTDLLGTYFHIIPRNSTFFYPEKRVRGAILDAVPEAAAVSLRRDSFSSLRVMTVPREESFIWCGASIDAPDPAGCFEADAEGYVFRPVPGTAASSSATSTAVREPVRIFAPLDRELAAGQSPVRATVAKARYLPDALKFVDAMRQLGAPVSSLAIRGDEADLWLNGPTRITYVLGQEKGAADVAASALPTLDLKGGSIQYIDLRFPGKAYVKRYGE